MSVVTKNSKNGAEIICTVFTEDKVPKAILLPFCFFCLDKVRISRRDFVDKTWRNPRLISTKQSRDPVKPPSERRRLAFSHYSIIHIT